MLCKFIHFKFWLQKFATEKYDMKKIYKKPSSFIHISYIHISQYRQKVGIYKSTGKRKLYNSVRRLLYI